MKKKLCFIFLIHSFLGAQVNNLSCENFNLLENVNYKCGYIDVPYNHFQESQKTINISFVLIDKKNSKEIPLAILTGGPGGSAITQSRVNYWLSSPLSDNRNVIIFDQRGIGFSSKLKNINNEFSSIFRKNLNFTEEKIEVKKLLSTYVDDANNNGIDLSLYNTFQSAVDLDLIMQNLKINKYNLYGSSYGTRLGRVIQELFPERLNAVILNSPNPLDGGDMLLGRLDAYSRSLNRLFEYCKNNFECSSSHPELENQYIETINKLIDNPIELDINNAPYFVNAEEGVYFIRRLLYRNSALNDVPVLIDELGGNGNMLITNLVKNEFRDSYNYAMWFAVERYEMFNENISEEDINKIYNKYDTFPAKLGFFTSVYINLNYFHDETLKSNKKKLKKSNVPTLVTVNKYDPVTPPEDAYKMVQTLNNFKLYVLNEAGHGGGNQNCRNNVMMQFLLTPNADIDVSCLDIIN